MATITFDFESSLAAIYKSEISELGIDVSQLSDNDGIFNAYYTLDLRLVETRKRKIHKPKNFICPQDVEPGLKLLESKIVNGQNICPHLSNSITKLDFFDGMLLDWGISHFHLGSAFRSDGMVERTSALLYAKVLPNDTYFLKIASHGEWSNTSLLEIIDSNWPGIIQNYLLGSNVSVERVLSDKDINLLRNGHINEAIRLSSGRCYASIGGGYMVNGNPTVSIKKITQMNSIFRKVEKFVKNNELSLCKQIDPDVSKHANLSFNFICKRDGDVINFYDDINNNFLFPNEKALEIKKLKDRFGVVVN